MCCAPPVVSRSAGSVQHEEVATGGGTRGTDTEVRQFLPPAVSSREASARKQGRYGLMVATRFDIGVAGHLTGVLAAWGRSAWAWGLIGMKASEAVGGRNPAPSHEDFGLRRFLVWPSLSQGKRKKSCFYGLCFFFFVFSFWGEINNHWRAAAHYECSYRCVGRRPKAKARSRQSPVPFRRGLAAFGAPKINQFFLFCSIVGAPVL